MMLVWGEYTREVQLGWAAESAVSRVSLRYIQQFFAMEDPILKNAPVIFAISVKRYYVS